MTKPDEYANVRYIVDDVQAAVDFYTAHLGNRLRGSRSCVVLPNWPTT